MSVEISSSTSQVQQSYAAQSAAVAMPSVQTESTAKVDTTDTVSIGAFAEDVDATESFPAVEAANADAVSDKDENGNPVADGDKAEAADGTEDADKAGKSDKAEKANDTDETEDADKLKKEEEEKTLEEQQAELQEDVDKLNEDLEAKQKELEEKQKEQEELEKEQEQLQQELEKAMEEGDEEKIAELKGRLDDIGAQLETLGEEIEALNQDIKGINTDLEAKQKELDGVNKEIEGKKAAEQAAQQQQAAQNGGEQAAQEGGEQAAPANNAAQNGGNAGNNGGTGNVGGTGGSGGAGGVGDTSGTGSAGATSTRYDFSKVSDKDMAAYIDKYLASKGSPAAGTGAGEMMVKYGKENNVDPLVLLAIAGQETQWGKTGIGVNGMLGVGAYDSDPNNATRNPTFSGVENQIKKGAETFARLRERGGASADDDMSVQTAAVNKAGWATDQNWHNGVDKLYNQITADAAKELGAPAIQKAGVNDMLSAMGSMVGMSEHNNSDAQKINAITGESGINCQTTPWCAAYAMNMLKDYGVLDSSSCSNINYCPTIRNWAKDQNLWEGRSSGYTPNAGDAILFDWNGDGTAQHIGVVERVEGGKVYTIEGNSSDSVARRSYDLNSSVVMGYINCSAQH